MCSVLGTGTVLIISYFVQILTLRYFFYNKYIFFAKLEFCTSLSFFPLFFKVFWVEPNPQLPSYFGLYGPTQTSLLSRLHILANTAQLKQVFWEVRLKYPFSFAIF